MFIVTSEFVKYDLELIFFSSGECRYISCFPKFTSSYNLLGSGTAIIPSALICFAIEFSHHSLAPI